MAKPTYPRTIKRAGLSAKLYRYKRQKNGATYEEFILTYSEAGKRRMRSFSDPSVAEAEAEKILGDLAKGIVGGSDMTVSERQDYGLAASRLAPFGVPISTAAAEYAKARELLGDKASLLDAVTFYLNRANPDLPKRTVAQVAEEMIAHKRDVDKVSTRDLNDIRERCPHFASKFPDRLISSITAVEINGYVASISGSKRTRYNYRTAVVRLFNFAKAKGYLARDRETEAQLSEPVKDGTKVGKVEIYTPAELRILLARQDKRTIPFVALNAFSGLRHAEICRLRWKDIWWHADKIHVQAEKAKVGEERYVPLLPTLRVWLEPHRPDDGNQLVIGDVKRIQNMASRLNRRVTMIDSKTFPSVAWLKNGLRHSFISYRLAILKNRAEVAEEAGTSPAMIKKHYRRPILDQEAALYWSLLPEHCALAEVGRRPELALLPPVAPVQKALSASAA